MEIMICLSFVTASISFTVTETKLFKPIRQWAKKKNHFFGEMISCGYCFAHWLAIALVVIYGYKQFTAWWLLDCFLTALIIAWLGAFQWIFLCG
jgi:hypothetical protein